MRKLIYAINVSLDGCCDHIKLYADEELLEYYTQLLRNTGLLVYGRKTYEIIVPYWPDIAKRQTETRAPAHLLTPAASRLLEADPVST